MKKKLISLVTVGALMIGGLAVLSACGKKENQSNNETPSSVPAPSSDSGTPAKYAVSVKIANEDKDNVTVSGLKDEYAAGETVTFNVTVTASGKRISAVRVNNEKINANADGSYSFTMPAEEVEIRIVLADVVEPVLEVSYTGQPLVGQTLTISASIDSVATSEFTVAAKSGADLVTINGKQVTLKAAGSAVLEISASKDGFNLKKELALTISVPESSLGTNITYDDHAPASGIESSANEQRGKIITCAVDGGSISSLTYNAANDLYTMSYGNGWAFWSDQLFFSLPYSSAGETYHLRWDVNSDAAGIITISGQRVNLQNGDNHIAIDVTQGTGALISIQLGIMEGEEHVLLNGAQLKFSSFRLYDANSANKYHLVTFKNGTEVLKEIYVREGQPVVAPSVTAPSGYSFVGFYEGENEFSASAAITAAHTYTAKIVEMSAETTKHVTIKIGSETIAVIDVMQGYALSVPETVNYGFGRHLVGLYRDAAFAQAYDMNAKVESDLVLYAKTRIQYDATFTNTGDLGYSIPNDWISYADDGAITLTFNGWGAGEKWYVQANFDANSFPRGDAGKTYTISFTYSINQEGAGAQIYDGNTIDNVGLETGNNKTASLTYQGGVLNNGYKLTFELGNTPLNQQVIFTLHNISLSVA